MVVVARGTRLLDDILELLILHAGMYDHSDISYFIYRCEMVPLTDAVRTPADATC